jgi:hypothetical protein
LVHFPQEVLEVRIGVCCLGVEIKW